MFSICCIHKTNAIWLLTESLYVELVENWGNAHKTVMWLHFGLVQICSKPRNMPFKKVKWGSVQTSLTPHMCLSSSHFHPNIPKFLASWQIQKTKCHTICHSNSNFPTSSWRMPWALAGPMPHGAVAPALMQNTGGIAARSSAVDQEWLQRRSLAE